MNDFINFRLYKLSTTRGIAALPLVLMVGGLITAITLALLVANLLATQSEFGLRLSSQAFTAAQSGVQDAFLRIVRDKTFTGSYAITFADGSSAAVTVCKDSIAPVCVGVGKDLITALGQAQTRNRKFQAVVDLDAVTGEAKLESLNEVAL